MQDVVYGAAAELIEIAVYAVAAGFLTAAGLFAEFTGIESFLAGDATLGLWLAYMGIIAIYAGVFQAGYRSLRPALDRRLARRSAD